MALQDEILKRIKTEIETDPDNLGYKDKTDDELVDMLNNGITRQKLVDDPVRSPVNRILSGLGNAANVVTKAEVMVAKTMTIVEEEII